MRTTFRRLALPLLLLGSGALPAAAQSRAAAPVALRGDVNGDGQVTVLDALAVLAFVVGKPLPAGYAVPVAGDADGSGTVSTMDALVIAGFAAGRDVGRFPVGKQMPAVRADAVECAAEARSATLTCGAPRLLAGAATQPLVVGGQDVYVRLTSRNTHFNDTTRILSADVRVTNLLAQTLGLEPDGTPSPEGVRVFFNNIHSSAVSVMDVDGEETFLAPNQVFYQYGAALAPGDSTPLKTWRWHLPDGVNTFTFRVYATGAVQYPGDNTNQADLARDRDEGVTLNLVSGGGQTGPAGQPLPQPVVVRVLDVNKKPLADRVVNFLAGNGGSASPVQTRTDTAGYARTTWTLGPGSGTQEMRVSGTGGTLLVTATTGTPAPVVASVRITPDSLVLLPGDTGTFTARAYDANGAPVAGTAAWTTADSTFARVSATGRVTAVAVGTVQITATIAGVSASARVRVKPVPVGPVVRVVVSPDTFIMYPNQRRHFTATAYDAAGHVVNAGYFKWSSSDSTYVNVDLNGYVLALGAGTTTITATVSGVSGSGRVIVPLPTTYPMRVTWIERRSVVCCLKLETGPSEFGVNFSMDVSRASNTASLRLRSPAGETTSCTMAGADDYVRRTFTCTLALPANSAPGIWKVDQVVVDGRVLNAAGLDSMDTPGRRLIVFGPPTPDNAPPEISTVVPELHSGVYYVKFGVHDFRSNVTSVSAVFRGPGGQQVTCNASTSTNDYRSADWLCRLPTATVGSGRWSLVSVTATDAVGNSATYTPEQIEPIRGVYEYTFLWMEFDA